MLDIQLIRQLPDVVRESQRRRHAAPGVVDAVLAADKEWRDANTRIDQLRAERNRKNQEVKQLKQVGGDIRPVISAVKGISQEIKQLEVRVVELKGKRDSQLREIPNILHESVPPGETEEDNVPIRFWGKALIKPGDTLEEFNKATGGKMQHELIDWHPISHVDILEQAGLADISRAGKVAGARFYYLLGDLVKMDFGLQWLGLKHMAGKGYTIVQPPYMLNKAAYEGVTDMETFEDALYKIEDEDLFLISTSEHPLCAMYMDELLFPEQLPMKYAGISPCFRKEAGAHGKDQKGIFRVHQFHKIEQFIFTKEEGCWDFHEELIKNAEELYQSLGIPYRVVNVCAGEMGGIASKKYDMEVWMASQGRFREVVSASNCLDYQARRLNIRYRHPDGNRMVYTLNSTTIATSRTIVAILENNQTPDGSAIKVPKPLVEFVGTDEIALK